MAKTAGAARHHITPIIRGAFLNALDIMERVEGKTFSQIMYEEIKEHGLLTVLDRIAKFQERTGTLDVNHRGESLAEILTSLGAGRDSTVESEPDSIRH